MDDSHPFHVLKRLVAMYPHRTLVFKFSSYEHIDYDECNRKFFMLDSIDLDEGVPRIIASLEDGENLAVSSEVICTSNGNIYHIPLVDFSSPKLNECVNYLGPLYAELFGDSPHQLYSSGRSYHGYVIGLLSRDEWYKFMGKLVLMNAGQVPEGLCLEEDHLPQPVDLRWLGRRIMEGYGSLRWTCRTENYYKVPELVRN